MIRVLTIDDNSSMTELLGTFLRNYGMDVISCNDGHIGIEMARKEKPNIIILDLLNPGTNEWEICKALRAFTNTPIAILSAHDDPAEISKALDAGADDYLTKPIPGNILIAHIKNLARRHIVENNSTSMIRELGLANLPTNDVNFF